MIGHAVKLLTLAAIIVSLFGSSTAEAKSYTKSELQKMIKAKKYPKTENPREESRSFDFKMCRAIVNDDRMEKDEEGYPTLVVRETKDLIIVKIWQSHMMTISTCKDGNLTNVDYDYSL